MNAITATAFIFLEARKLWKEASLYYPVNEANFPKINLVCKASNSAGRAYWNLKKGVDFNLSYFCSHPNTEDLREVIAHELAHVITFICYPKAKQFHGPEFREVMQFLGYKGNTYHRMQKPSKDSVQSIQEDLMLSIL